MKILNISTVPLEKNGISKFILSCYEKISSKYIQIDIIAPNNVSDDIKKIINGGNGNVIELPFRKKNTYKYFKTLIKIIKKEKYDIVHVHGNSCTVSIELFAALIARCKVRIAHSHNTTCTHKLANKILRPVFELSCTYRIACGQKAGEWLFHKKKFEIIQNGIDIDRYKCNLEVRRKIRNKLKLEEEDILLGSIGTFNYQKNHDFLLEIMKELKKDNRFKMVLIGDGELREDIEEKIKRNNMQDKVILIGNVDNVSEYLQAIDLFLLSSRFEGIPYVLIEAQVSGTKCIVSNCVSREADITQSVMFLDLNKKLWIDRICSIDIKKEENVEFDKEYNLNNNTQKLLGIYKRIN